MALTITLDMAMALPLRVPGIPAAKLAMAATGAGTFVNLPNLRRWAPFPVVMATAGDPLGDLGARDPFPAELESNFGDRTLGHASTDHVILIPNSSLLGLADKSCVPISPGQAPLSAEEAKPLLRKIVGWRLVQKDGILRLQCEWKVRDHSAGEELMHRISAVADLEGHQPDFQFDQQTNTVTAQLWTHSIGGLSENNFIMAAKIDRIKTSDLIKRHRVWA